MSRVLILVSCLSVLGVAVFAQAAARERIVRATGQAVISVQPDQAKINVGVVTLAATAEQAASQNASKVEAVLTELRRVLGSDGEMKTISYSLNPNYRHSSGEPPVLTGFTASNTLQVTIGDLSLIGRTIDAASQAGANTLHGLRFAIQDPEPVRREVLGLAAKQAKAHADAIASGLGARTGVVLAAQEGAYVGVQGTELRDAVMGGASTPIETGLVEVYATVTVEVELLW